MQVTAVDHAVDSTVNSISRKSSPYDLRMMKYGSILPCMVRLIGHCAEYTMIGQLLLVQLEYFALIQ